MQEMMPVTHKWTAICKRRATVGFAIDIAKKLNLKIGDGDALQSLQDVMIYSETQPPNSRQCEKLNLKIGDDDALQSLHAIIDA